MNLKTTFCLGRVLPLLSIILIMTPCLGSASEQGVRYADQAYNLLIEGKDLPAILSYRRAISEGLNDPSIMRNMALAFYNLRMLDEAIEFMEMGVEASPKDPNMLCELGILYGARGELQKATSMLKDSLQLDPGQGEAYFYLGLSLMRQGNTHLAWQAARIGEKLHFNQDLLLEQLLLVRAPEPKHYPFQDPSPIIALRQIRLDSAEQGETLVARWQRGESLEEFFLGETTDVGGSVGGYVGAFTKNELKPEAFAAVSDSDVYGLPVIVKTDDTYLLVQRIWPFNPVYWSESEEQRIEIEPAENFAPVVVSGRLDSLPLQVAGKADSGAEDTFKLEKVDPQKIKLYSGSYHQKEHAIEQVVNLRAQSFLAYYLKDTTSDGKTVFNVIAGEYSSRAEGLMAMQKLREKGFESFLSLK